MTARNPLRRRHRRLNAALHEIRRPVQVLTLLLERGSGGPEATRACISSLRSAIKLMDEAVNGVEAGHDRTRISAADLLAGVETRWRGLSPVSCGPGADRDRVEIWGDPAALGRALDNLVANAIEHGSAPIELGVNRGDGCVDLEVRDGGLRSRQARANGDPRRGHGVAIAANIAEEHGGVALPPQFSEAGTVVALRIPIATPRRES